MRTPRQTKLRRAVLSALACVPANYLMSEPTVLADAARLAAPRPSVDELKTELAACNTDGLVYGRPGEDAMKWKLTEAGHAWIDENP